MDIATGAPEHSILNVPVHADCHWGNWFVAERHVTVLLDFEWARCGEPLDDWFFLVRFSGRHMEDVLNVIARDTATPHEAVRAGCEVREAAHLASDLFFALQHPGANTRIAKERLQPLDELVVGRYWWRPRR